MWSGVGGAPKERLYGFNNRPIGIKIPLQTHEPTLDDMKHLGDPNMPMYVTEQTG